jgi:hypothetical protein
MVAVLAVHPVKDEQWQACNEWPRNQVEVRSSSARPTWTGIEQGRLEARRALPSPEWCQEAPGDEPRGLFLFEYSAYLRQKQRADERREKPQVNRQGLFDTTLTPPSWGCVSGLFVRRCTARHTPAGVAVAEGAAKARVEKPCGSEIAPYLAIS